MKTFTLAAIMGVLACSSALAQNTNQSGPPLPQNPGATTSGSSDENGISPLSTPGANPNGSVMDSTRSGDDGAYARQNSGSTTGQAKGPGQNSTPRPSGPGVGAEPPR
jgi:hypothetical protein